MRADNPVVRCELFDGDRLVLAGLILVAMFGILATFVLGMSTFPGSRGDRLCSPARSCA